MGTRLGVLALTLLLVVLSPLQPVYPGILPPPNPGTAPDDEPPTPWGHFFIIESDPPGATITVNDNEDGGKTPRRFTYAPFLKQERTVIEFRKEGYHPQQLILDFTAKDEKGLVISKSPGVQFTWTQRFFYQEFAVRVVLSENVLTTYENARRENTVTAYRRFAERNPDAVFADDARVRMVELEFRAAERVGTAEAFRDFLEKTDGVKAGPAEILRRSARQRQHELAFAESRKANSSAAYEQYLRAHPDSPYAYEAKARLAALKAGQRDAEAGAEAGAFAEAKRLDTEAAYQSFLGRFPRSVFAAEAAALEFQAAERRGTADAYRQYVEGARGDVSAVRAVLRREAERRLQALAYARAKQVDTVRGYEGFASANADSLFTGDAKDRAEYLRKEIRARTESARRFEEQGNYLDAILDYQVAVRHDPENAEYPYRLARLYLRERKLDEARRAIQTALERDPNNTTFRALMEEINRISRTP